MNKNITSNYGLNFYQKPRRKTARFASDTSKITVFENQNDRYAESSLPNMTVTRNDRYLKWPSPKMAVNLTLKTR